MVIMYARVVDFPCTVVGMGGMSLLLIAKASRQGNGIVELALHLGRRQVRF